jgi:ElaB/YqjD/DUF883 family membrane-anchored ribosome-binding protein
MEINMANAAARDAMDSATNLGNKFKGRFKRVEDRLDRISHDAGERVGERAAEVVDSFSEYAESGRKYMKKNPRQSMMIAAAVGLGIGWTMLRARKRR